ncbi:MAG TPA: sporulation integral membrane protein YtvI [Limnochordia bacterium]|nr:sporulation integral membrane protein YtvI [Limnochordia bacterium]
MSVERRKEFVIHVLYFSLLVAIFYVVVKYLLGLVAPFIVGFLVAAVLQRSIGFLSIRLRFPKKLAAIVCVLLFYVVIGVLLFWLGVGVFAWLKDFVERLPTIYTTEIEPLIMQSFHSIEVLMARFDLSLVQIFEDFLVSLSQSLGKIVSDMSSLAIAGITATVSSVPRLFFGLVLSVISSVFFALDYGMILDFFSNWIPPKQKDTVEEIKVLVGEIGVKYIKAYALLMLITFIELAVGLSILRVRGAVAIAAFTAIVDILPVLGTGGVIVPWAVFHLIKGNLSLGIGLMIIYIIVTVVRQVLEPKVVGQQIGLHPIVVLACMYVGLRLFGVIGLFVLPFTILVLRYLSDHLRLRPN